MRSQARSTPDMLSAMLIGVTVAHFSALLDPSVYHDMGTAGIYRCQRMVQAWDISSPEAPASSAGIWSWRARRRAASRSGSCSGRIARQIRPAGAGLRARAASLLVPVSGDLEQPLLGVSASERARDCTAASIISSISARSTISTRRRRRIWSARTCTAPAMRSISRTSAAAGCFHLVSSIAAAGRYRGTFTERMFDEAEGLDLPYFRTKHESEALVRSQLPGSLAHLPPRHGRGPLAHRRHGQDRRPVLFLQGDSEIARLPAALGAAGRASRADTSTWCRWTSSPRRSRTSRTRRVRTAMLSPDRSRRIIASATF